MTGQEGEGGGGQTWSTRAASKRHAPHPSPPRGLRAPSSLGGGDGLSVPACQHRIVFHLKENLWAEVAQMTQAPCGLPKRVAAILLQSSSASGGGQSPPPPARRWQAQPDMAPSLHSPDGCPRLGCPLPEAGLSLTQAAPNPAPGPADQSALVLGSSCPWERRTALQEQITGPRGGGEGELTVPSAPASETD